MAVKNYGNNKPLLRCSKTMLGENDQILSHETTITDSMIEFLVYVTNNLKSKINKKWKK